MLVVARFMLNAERGDCGSVAAIIEQAGGRGRVQGDRWEHQRGTCTLIIIPTLNPVPSFDLNCTDPLGRTALSIAIINENPELMEILLDAGILTFDSLLLAIDEEYIEVS